MRRILLALIVLACAVPPAEAARRDDTRQTASRQQASAPAQRAAPTRQAAPRGATQASRQAPRQSNLRPGDVRTQRSGLVVRGASAATAPRNSVAPRAAAPRNAMANNCTRRNGRTVCAPARSSIAGWQRGLPTMSYAQRECPSGTFATLARGHDDVVRCMPL